MSAVAQTIPGAADVGRVKPEERQLLAPDNQNANINIPSGAAVVAIPVGAEKIHLTLRALHIEGATAFSQAELQPFYAPYLGHDITLDRLYVMANAITKLYRAQGYFLSLAYVPVQQINQGIVTIKIIEGYIGEVDLPSSVRAHYVVQAYIDRLMAQKPLSSAAMESFLLRLNDLPGLSFRSVLSAADKGEGIIKLTLIPSEKAGQGVVSFDNYSSRFLGPNEATAEYSTSLLPLQQTTVSGLSSLPVNKLKYATLEHAITIWPDIVLDVSGNFTKAHPGYTLDPEDVRSQASFLSASLSWQAIRQREENLSLKLGFDGRDTTTDLLDTLFTKDHIRALRMSANYDVTDSWQGSNTGNLIVSQGLNILDASGRNDPDLSRAGATPTFTKAELSLSRLQGITPHWSALLSADGQLTADRLYSSEQFGYGGQAYGRAFDASDLTGDQGVNGAIELRYDGWQAGETASFQPYSFYDIGTVWNKGHDPESHQSGSSIGLGMRVTTRFNLSGNLGLAFPLTRKISDPIYGGDHTGPRLLLQISLLF